MARTKRPLILPPQRAKKISLSYLIPFAYPICPDAGHSEEPSIRIRPRVRDFLSWGGSDRIDGWSSQRKRSIRQDRGKNAHDLR